MSDLPYNTGPRASWIRLPKVKRKRAKGSETKRLAFDKVNYRVVITRSGSGERKYRWKLLCGGGSCPEGGTGFGRTHGDATAKACAARRSILAKQESEKVRRGLIA